VKILIIDKRNGTLGHYLLNGKRIKTLEWISS